jgi:hypothetical protein
MRAPNAPLELDFAEQGSSHLFDPLEERRPPFIVVPGDCCRARILNRHRVPLPGNPAILHIALAVPAAMLSQG